MSQFSDITPKSRFLSVGIDRTYGPRIRKSALIAQKVQDDLNVILENIRFFDRAPFERVFLTYYYDHNTDLTPQLDPIDPEHKEVPVSITIGFDDCRGRPLPEIERQFFLGALGALIAVAIRFGLPRQELEQRLSEYQR